MKKVFKISLYALLTVLIITATFLATLFLGGFGKIPSKSDLQELKNETATLVYAKNGELIGKFFSENRTNIPYDSLPKHLIEALIATEDARFYEHEGVDGKALIRVLLKTIIIGDRSAGGGSTLSQQLAKNLFGRKDYGKISIGVNKLKEIILANRLEEIYSKQEIITLYLNTVPFGENVFGIEAAAQRFFSKSVESLTIEQSAVLVGMLKANTRYNPRLNPENAFQRRAVILQQMNKYGYLSRSEADSLNKSEIELNYNNLSITNKAPYYLNQLEKELSAVLNQIEKETGKTYHYKKDGLSIKSTLNINLQEAGKKAMQKHLSSMQSLMDKQYSYGSSKKELIRLAEKIAKREKVKLEGKSLKKRNLFNWNKTDTLTLTTRDSLLHILRQLHAGILGVDPQSGSIECWVGGLDYNYFQFDQVMAKRQLASLFKPILYAQVLRSGRTPCDYISNEPIVLNDYDNWTPKNYDGSSGGNYSLAAALAYSMNLPTVHLYFETAQTELAQLWSDLGFIDELNKDPSVILGTNSVNMLELATAYSTFANGGKLIDTYMIESITDGNGNIIYQKPEKKFPQVLEEKTTQQISAILEKAIDKGTGNAIRNKYGITIPLAGKTGTSQNYADAWFIAYNKNITLVSRVGASYPSVHFKQGALGSGSKLALPLIGLSVKESLKDQEFKTIMSKSSLNTGISINCDDFKKADFIDNVFNVFKKKETSLESEQKRAKKKKKVKGFFKSVFGNKDK